MPERVNLECNRLHAEPTSVLEIPEEETSWGDLKRMFR